MNITSIITEKLTVNIFTLFKLWKGKWDSCDARFERIRLAYTFILINNIKRIMFSYTIECPVPVFIYQVGVNQNKMPLWKEKKVFLVKQYQYLEFGWRSTVWSLWKEKYQHTQKIMNYNNNRNNKCRWSMIVWVSVVVNRNVVDSDWC